MRFWPFFGSNAHFRGHESTGIYDKRVLICSSPEGSMLQHVESIALMCLAKKTSKTTLTRCFLSGSRAERFHRDSLHFFLPRRSVLVAKRESRAWSTGQRCLLRLNNSGRGRSVRFLMLGFGPLWAMNFWFRLLQLLLLLWQGEDLGRQDWKALAWDGVDPDRFWCLVAWGQHSHVRHAHIHQKHGAVLGRSNACNRRGWVEGGPKRTMPTAA